jgi:hypothetical protein
MLFPYQYVPHQMEKMQEFIDYIFYEVWCKAPGAGSFSLDLFDANADLKEVMTAFFYGDTIGGDFFYSHVEHIYVHFAALTPEQIDQFKQWYQANNDIERVCTNDPDLRLVRYADITLLHKGIGADLATFFKGLYSKELLDLAVLKQKIGHIDDHYLEFVRANKAGKCPFCGISDIKGEHHTKREAYDHYLPKGLYPFNSINFRNLAPACHECNSSYKLGKDPVNTKVGPRKAFYPYAKPGYNININIDLKKADVDHLAPDDIDVECGPPTLHEEIETWKDVYGIEERYKARCCGENDGKYWVQQALDEWAHSPEEFMEVLAKNAAMYPFAECNFLKKAFLEGCARVGLL